MREYVYLELMTDNGQTLKGEVLKGIGQTIEDSSRHSDTDPTDCEV